MASKIYRIQRHGERGDSKTLSQLAGKYTGRMGEGTKAVKASLGPAKDFRFLYFGLELHEERFNLIAD